MLSINERILALPEGQVLAVVRSSLSFSLVFVGD